MKNKKKLKIEFIDPKKLDYSKIDYVVGLKEKSSISKFTHHCVVCGEKVYYVDEFPDDSVFIDIQCVIKKFKSESKKESIKNKKI